MCQSRSPILYMRSCFRRVGVLNFSPLLSPRFCLSERFGHTASLRTHLIQIMDSSIGFGKRWPMLDTLTNSGGTVVFHHYCLMEVYMPFGGCQEKNVGGSRRAYPHIRKRHERGEHSVLPQRPEDKGLETSSIFQSSYMR